MLTKLKNGKTWRSWLAVVSLLVCFFTSSLASAELKYIPQWQRLACGADLYACYTFEKAQLLLIIDLEFQEKEAELESALADVVGLKLINSKLEKSLGLLKENQERLETRVEEKNVLLQKNLQLTRELMQRDIFGEAFPWVIVVILVAAAGGFVGGYFVGN